MSWTWIIWLIGIPAAYVAWFAFLTHVADYTIRARARNIAASILVSWISVAVLLVIAIIAVIMEICEYLQEEIDWDDTARW